MTKVNINAYDVCKSFSLNVDIDVTKYTTTKNVSILEQMIGVATVFASFRELCASRKSRFQLMIKEINDFSIAFIAHIHTHIESTPNKIWP